MTSSFLAPNGAPSFGFDDDTALAAALDPVLAATPELLGLGEPTHGEPALPALRNRLFELLAERGYASIALETDAVAALEVDAFVRGGRGTLDAAMATGFSHGFGDLPANRELVAWMRAHNDTLPPARRLAFHGVDGPMEADLSPSPRPYLTHLHGYLLEHLGPDALPREAATRERGELDRLLGDDGRWTDRAALFDAAASIGGSPEARALRVLADDLVTSLHAEAPRLVAAGPVQDWHAAAVHGRVALGVLRYHATAATPRPAGARLSRMLAIRDELMAQNLHAVRDRERHRGATFVFAHNAHLVRHPARWSLPGMDVEWSGAGSIVAALGAQRYTVVAGSLGASDALGLTTPAATTFEGALESATGGGALLPDAGVGHRDDLHTRTDVTAEQGYAPLCAETLEHSDGVLHVATSPGTPRTGAPAPAEVDLAARILRDLPGVTHLRVGEEHEAASHSLGDWFFFAGDDARMPFATIVVHDTPGFDEDSALDRPGVFRLNIGVGRDEFERCTGFPPADLAQHLPGADLAALDRVVPHPAYGRQGWVAILTPTDGSLPEIDRLLSHAHRRAVGRSPVPS